MSDHLSLSTADPLFDPDRPLRVNGYLFLPARRILANVSGRAAPLEPVGGRHVDRSAERATPSEHDGPGAADPAHHPETKRSKAPGRAPR